MQQLREEHDEALNASSGNITTETIEELYKLRQTLENKNVVLWELVRSKTCWWEKLKVMQQHLN